MFYYKILNYINFKINPLGKNFDSALKRFIGIP